MNSQNKPKIDIVITTGGRLDMLERCLNSLNAYASIPITITVIDDGTDKEKRKNNQHLFSGKGLHPEKVNPNIVNFYTKRHEAREGFSKSNNEGARLGNAPLILFMNDDVEITGKFFDVLVGTMEDKSIGVLGAKLLFPDYSTDPKRPAGKVQHIGIALDVGANAVHPLVGWSADSPHANKSRECFAVTGACLTVRREAFRKVGGFDLIYGRGYWEDVDLCLKVRQLGYKVVINTDLVATHYTGASSTIDPSFASGFHINGMTFRSRWANTGLLVFDSWTYS